MPLSRFHDTVYLLKRGGLKDTLHAISQLELIIFDINETIPFGVSSLDDNNIENESIDLIRAANTVHILLAGLSRYREWPGVELRACRIISAFVSVENDHSVIQKYLMEILSALYLAISMSNMSRRDDSVEVIEENDEKEEKCNNDFDNDIIEAFFKNNLRSIVAAAVLKVSTVLMKDNINKPIISTNTNGRQRSFSNYVPSDTGQVLCVILNIIILIVEGDNDLNLMTVGQPVLLRPTGVLMSASFDIATVLCSAAMEMLAEVPSFRPALVSGGVLVLCRSLLELFIAKLSIAKKHRSKLNGSDNCEVEGINEENEQTNLMEEKLLACRSIVNITASLVHIIGGVSVFNNYNTAYLNGAHDYTISWIDFQVINEDLPRALLKVVSLGLQEWISNNIPIKNKDQARDEPCSFRHAVCMNISKAFFQLSSRANNRPALKNIGVPQALCILFAYSADLLENNTTCNTSEEKVTVEDLINETRHYSVSSQNELESNLRDYNIIADKVFSTHTVCASLDAVAFFLNDIKASETSSNLYNSIPLNFSLSMPKHPSFGSLHDDDEDDNSSNEWLVTPLLTMMCYATLIKGIKSVMTTLPRCPARLACLRVILSLTQWQDSLSALYIGDITDALVLTSAEAELHRQDNPRSSSNESKNGQGKVAKDVEKSCMFSLNSHPNGFNINNNSSNNNNSNNSSGGGNYNGSMNNSSMNNNNMSSNSTSSSSNNTNKSISNDGTVNLMKSSGSNGNLVKSVDGIHKSNSGTMLVKSVDGIHKSNSGTMLASRSKSITISSLKFSYEKACRDDGLKEEDKAALTTEETMTVCLALANISQSKEYAVRLFKNGLLNIMFCMVDSSHFEISRQAVRCVSALCTVISEDIDTRSSAKQRNSQLYSDALDALCLALKSPSCLVLKEAVIGINVLAATADTVREAIVNGPFKEIVGLLNDYTCCQETRSAAENVLKTLGFKGGLSDVEMCAFDVQLLRDWFNFKMSLHPHILATKVLERWISERLFKDGSLSSVMNSSHQETSEEETASMNHLYEQLEKNNIDAEKDMISTFYGMGSTGSGGIWPSPSRSIFGQSSRFSRSSFSQKHAQMSFFQLQRVFLDSLQKVLPFCSVRHDTHRSDSESDISLPSFTPRRNSSSPMFMNSSKSTSRSNTPPPQWMMHDSIDSTSDLTKKEMEWEYLEHPPNLVVLLLAIYCPSKLSHYVYSDFINLVSDPKLLDEQNKVITLPSPMELSALYIPRRSYNFRLMGRVIEKMMELDSKRKWALTFKDPSFEDAEDFHDTLMQVTRKYPQIVSLNFTNIGCSTGEESAKMGHLIGHIPSSVRFVHFNGGLSSDSVQALCIILKRANAAFVHPEDLNIPLMTPMSPKSRNKGSDLNASSFDVKPSTLSRYPVQGLLGLGITNIDLKPTDIEYIIELLTPNVKVTSSNTKSGRNSFKKDEPLNLEIPADANADTDKDISESRGIRFLDLTSSSLNALDCAHIINASLNGPLEGLDLSGSYLCCKGNATFLESLTNLGQGSGSNLRYLGLSRCGMSEKTFSAVLETLQNNLSITSLDLSMNGLGHSTVTKGAIRAFLKHNICIRVLDLCQNKFTTETIKEIYLGVLENSSILLLPLAGNIGVSQSKEMSLIQAQLLDNRLRYKRKLDALSKNILSTPLPPPVNVTAVPVNIDADDSRRILLGTVDHSLAVAIPIDHYDSNDSINTINESHDCGTGTIDQYDAEIIGNNLNINNAIDNVTMNNCDDENVAEALNTLKVFFSAPLAWRDRNNTLHPLDVLDYASERSALLQVFREVRRDINLCFDFATTDALRTALSFGCRAMHFSGHGHPNCLNFEDGRSGLQLVNVETLISLLKAGGLKLDFVFVSACHSRATAAAFVEAGVPHVVCVKVEAKIQDSAAMAFTRAFYLALLSGKTVKVSFDIAREALKASPYVPDSILEGEKFILLPDEGKHDVPIFNSKSILDWPGSGHLRRGHACMSVMDDDTMSSPSDDSNCHHDDDDFNQCWPSPPPDFEGREVDMYRVITTLHARRLVTLIGELGVGKSALASAVCTYASDRNMFGSGAVYVRALGIKTYPDLLTSVIKAMNTGLQKLRGGLRAQASYEGLSNSELHPLYAQEEFIVTSLSNLHVLLVLDHVDGLLADDDTSTDFKFFLSRLFDRCSHLKVLVVSTETLGMRHINFGVVEHSVQLGPLTLRNSLRLFARLAPALSTESSKLTFVQELLPAKLLDVTVNSRDISVVASKLLALFCNGHPARIVKMACESTPQSIDALTKLCQSIKQSTIENSSTVGTSIVSATPNSASFRNSLTILNAAPILLSPPQSSPSSLDNFMANTN